MILQSLANAFKTLQAKNKLAAFVVAWFFIILALPGSLALIALIVASTYGFAILFGACFLIATSCLAYGIVYDIMERNKKGEKNENTENAKDSS